MLQSPLNGKTIQKADRYEPAQVVTSFLKAVIDRFSMTLNDRSYSSQEYLALPVAERSNDEADAVDARFARYTLEWLGFGEANWNYNRPQEFAIKYRARLPKFDDGNIYVPQSAVLAQTRLPKLTLSALVGRGEVKNKGPLNGRIRALSARNLIVSTLPSTNPNAAALAQVLDLFLHETGRESETWAQAQSWQLPDTIAASAWLATYNTISQQAQASWQQFVALQHQCDDAVADWYGSDTSMRKAIAEGLPWAKRQKDEELEDAEDA